MDVTELIETNVSIAGVKSAAVKTLVILSAGAMKAMPDGKQKLSMFVEFNGRQLGWIPNKTTLTALSAVYGKETNAWVGKKVSLEVGTVNSKEAVLGKPAQ